MYDFFMLGGVAGVLFGVFRVLPRYYSMQERKEQPQIQEQSLEDQLRTALKGYQRRFRDECPVTNPQFTALYQHFDLLPVYVSRVLSWLSAINKSIQGATGEDLLVLQAQREQMLQYIKNMIFFFDECFIGPHPQNPGIVDLSKLRMAYPKWASFSDINRAYNGFIDLYFLTPMKTYKINTDPPQVDCAALIAEHLRDAEVKAHDPATLTLALDNLADAQAQLNAARDRVLRQAADREVEAVELQSRLVELMPSAARGTGSPKKQAE